MFLSIILLLAGFLFLIKGADYLVEGSSALAARMSVSEITIGLTVVAFGTSTPELIVNIMAGIRGTPDIVFGNVIGSNIVNILLILGVAGAINAIRTEKNTVWREIPFSLLAVLVLFAICNDQLLDDKINLLSRSDAIVLLLFFIIFLVYTFGISRVESRDKPAIKDLASWKILLYIIAGLTGLFLGGKLVVDNAIELAKVFGVSEKLIGLTIVSLGTSLPELMTSAVAALKKKPDIAIGNVVGSNIFNIFFILGIGGLISPVPFDSTLNFDIAILVIASLLLFVTMFTGRKRSLDRWEAIIFMILYFMYVMFLIFRK